MKPEIGTKVYCIYNEGILVDEVAFIGNESFIINSFGIDTYEDSWEWYYEDYEEKWFVDIERAIEKIISKAKEDWDGKYVIEKRSDNWWKLVEVN